MHGTLSEELIDWYSLKSCWQPATNRVFQGLSLWPVLVNNFSNYLDAGVERILSKLADNLNQEVLLTVLKDEKLCRGARQNGALSYQ